MSTMVLYTVASLERVYKDVRPQNLLGSYSCLLNEAFHFQIVLYSETDQTVRLHCQADLPIVLYRQEYVNGTTAPKKEGEYYETGRDCYPDPLCPLQGEIFLRAGEYQAVWVKVNAQKVGKQNILCVAETEKGSVEKSVQLTVLPVQIERTDAILTNWIHYDCICAKHGVEPFSEGFYKALDKYLSLYVEAGYNTLYLPLFTPPLDTAIGNERLTVQAVEIEKRKGKYYFDFSRLKTLVSYAKEKGIRYFEFSHLFTQWGAKSCPKIMGKVRGQEKRLFFWGDKSYGKKYKRFLSAFLRALVSFIKENKLQENSFLHISDEPWWKFEGNYFRLSKFVRKYTRGLKIMDAVSTDKFYQKGAQDLPVYSNLKGKLMENGTPFLFYYACDSKFSNLTNRFFYMPLVRTRVLGSQMALTGANGFLHWGFNFYNAQYSVREVDPWVETDAGGNFPSGDSFIVYPKDGEVFPSIRLFTMQEAFFDYFALESLKRKRGEKFVQNFLRESRVQGLSVYPQDVEKYLQFRTKINEYLCD